MTFYVNGKKVCPTEIYNVPVTGIKREISSEGTLQMPKTSFDFKLPNQAIDLRDYALYYSLYRDSGVTSADFSSLKNITGRSALSYAFSSCENFTSVDFSSLETIHGREALDHAFYECELITSVDFPNLKSVTSRAAFSSAFQNCSLTSVSLPSLEVIGLDIDEVNCSHFSKAFYNNQSDAPMMSLSFPELTTIYCTGTSSSSNGTFYDIGRTIDKIYLPKLTTITYGTGARTSYQEAYKKIFAGTSLTEIHFGAVNQAIIEANPGYSTLWGRGAGNATVYFDL